MASALSGIDTYMITSAKKVGDYTILLVANDNESESFANKNYTVVCNSTGSNNFVGITGDTGRYLILKYRSTNNAYIQIDALTSDYEHTQTGANMATQKNRLRILTPVSGKPQ